MFVREVVMSLAQGHVADRGHLSADVEVDGCALLFFAEVEGWGPLLDSRRCCP